MKCRIPLFVFRYICIEACIVKLLDEVCASHMKHVGENISYTTQVVCRGAVHWITFQNIQFFFFYNLYIFQCDPAKGGALDSLKCHCIAGH